MLAGIGAAAIGYEKTEQALQECVKRGEKTVEKGKAANEELKRRLRKDESEAAASEIDLESMSPEARAELKERLLALEEQDD